MSASFSFWSCYTFFSRLVKPTRLSSVLQVGHGSILCYLVHRISPLFSTSELESIDCRLPLHIVHLVSTGMAVCLKFLMGRMNAHRIILPFRPSLMLIFVPPSLVYWDGILQQEQFCLPSIRLGAGVSLGVKPCSDSSYSFRSRGFMGLPSW